MFTLDCNSTVFLQESIFEPSFAKKYGEDIPERGNNITKAWKWKTKDGQRDDWGISAARGGSEARVAGRDQIMTDLHATLRDVNFNNKVRGSIEQLGFWKDLYGLKID